MSWELFKRKLTRRSSKRMTEKQAREFLTAAGIHNVTKPLKYPCTVARGKSGHFTGTDVAFYNMKLGRVPHPIVDFVRVDGELVVVACVFCHQTTCRGSCVDVFGPPDRFSCLPQEIKKKILSYLPLDELCRVAPFVSREWRLLAYDSSLWTTFDKDNVSPLMMAYLFHRSGETVTQLTVGYLGPVGDHRPVKIWSRYCPNLTKLQLVATRGRHEALWAGEMDIHTLVKNCPNITDLVVRKRTINGWSWKAIFKWENLVSLDLTECELFNCRLVATEIKLHMTNSVRGMSPLWPRLLRLKLPHISRDVIADLTSALVNTCPNVREFGVESCINRETVETILLWEGLAVVDLAGCQLSPRCVETLANTSLVLRGISLPAECRPHDVDLLVDRSRHHFRRLRFEYRLDDESGVISLALCYALTEFSVRDCRSLSDDFLPALKHLSDLTRLSLWYGENFSSTALTHLFTDGKLHNLRHLKLEHCTQVDDRVVAAVLDKCGAVLLELNLSGCKKVTDVSCVQIVNTCRALQSLELLYCDIKDNKWMRDIPTKMPRLTKLVLFRYLMSVKTWRFLRDSIEKVIIE